MDVKVRFDTDGRKKTYLYSGTVVDSGQFNIDSNDNNKSVVLVSGEAKRVVVAANQVCHLRVLCGGNEIGDVEDSTYFSVGNFTPAISTEILNEGAIYFATEISADDVIGGTDPDDAITTAAATMEFIESSQKFYATSVVAEQIAGEYMWALRQSIGRFISVQIPDDMPAIAITASVRGDNPAFIQYIGLDTEE